LSVNVSAEQIIIKPHCTVIWFYSYPFATLRLLFRAYYIIPGIVDGSGSGMVLKTNPSCASRNPQCSEEFQRVRRRRCDKCHCRARHRGGKRGAGVAAAFSHLFVTDDHCTLSMSWVLELEIGGLTMLFSQRESTWEFCASG